MMKGEYNREEEEQISSNSNPQITTDTPNFPKFQNYPHFLPLHHYQHFPTPDSTPPSKRPKPAAPTTTTSSEDGGSIELSRRPRGRPPGSKNKPKPPIVLTHQPDPLMSPYILELQSGSDLVESLTRFTRRRNVSICVLNATGAVVNVTLKQPSIPSNGGGGGGTVTFHGRFEILSLSSCIMSQAAPFSAPVSDGFGFTVSLAGPQGQIIGGKVAGPLFCAGTVYVVATSFNNPGYCRLPVEIDENINTSNNNNNEVDRVTDGDGNGNGNGDGEGSGTHMSLYSDVGWASHSHSSAVVGVRPPHSNY